VVSQSETMDEMEDRMETKTKGQALVIEAPKLEVAEFLIVGSTPYVQNKFSAKARQQMKETQEAGSTAKKGKKREKKDFKATFEGAMHISEEGWHGIPAPAFRNALISACRVVGFQMTKAKLSVFVLADGFDKDDATPLVRITKGAPKPFDKTPILPVRNASGVVDLRARPMWAPGWQAKVRVQYDADQFTVKDVANLLMRVGKQVGIGEGRPDSKSSAGMGWGLFDLKEK